jgi:hypothetical protein
MNRRTAMIIAAGIVLSLMAGTVSRVLTLHTTAAAPITITVQTAPPSVPAAAASEFETESLSA